MRLSALADLFAWLPNVLRGRKKGRAVPLAVPLAVLLGGSGKAMPGRLTPVISVGTVATPASMLFGSVGATLSAGGGTASDFASRVASLQASGTLLRAVAFNQDTELGSNWNAGAWAPVMYIPPTDPNGVVPSVQQDPAFPADPTKKALRFRFLSNTGSDGCGSWVCDFTDDLSYQLGSLALDDPNYTPQEVFIQCRVWWPAELLNLVILANATDSSGAHRPQGGIKFFDVIAGSMWGHIQLDPWGSCGQYYDAQGNPVTAYWSSSRCKQVITTWYQHRTPMMYGYDGQAITRHMCDNAGNATEFIQNVAPHYPGCTNVALDSAYVNTGDPTAQVAACWTVPCGEWITVQMAVQCGARTVFTDPENGVQYYAFGNARTRLWFGFDGQPQELILDWRAVRPDGVTPTPMYWAPLAGDPTYQQRIGKITLFPYMTDKWAGQTHPTLDFFYKELIVAKQFVPDPGSASAATHPSLQLAAGELRDLGTFPGSGIAIPAGWTTDQRLDIATQSKEIYDESNHRMILWGGGHAASNYEAPIVLDLTAGSTLDWAPLYAPLVRNDYVYSNYDFVKGAWLGSPSGNVGGPFPRPAARHSIDLFEYLPADATASGHAEMVVLGPVEGNDNKGDSFIGDWSATGQSSDHYANVGNPIIAHYDLTKPGTATDGWSWTHPTTGVSNPTTGTSLSRFPSAAYDPISKKVWTMDFSALDMYDPIARTRTRVFSGLSGHVFDEAGNIVPDSEAGIALQQDQNFIYYPPNQKLYWFFSPGAIYELELPAARTATSVVGTGTTNYNSSTVRIVKLTTTGGPAQISGQETGIGYDSVNELLGTITGDSADSTQWNKFWTFDPIGHGTRAAKTWLSKDIPIATACPGKSGTGGTQLYHMNYGHHAFGFDPVNNCYIIVSGTSSWRTFAYRWA